VAVSEEELGCRRANPLPFEARSGEAISRFLVFLFFFAGAATPPHTTSPSTNVQPPREHSNEGFVKSWDGGVGSHPFSAHEALFCGYELLLVGNAGKEELP